jgi:dipeptidyl aminopeptidase/acylaminoacyl peptidase
MTHHKRPITIDDLHRIALVDDPRISPDGQWVAYVQTTVDKLDNGYKRNIWLAPVQGGEPIQLTRSGKDTQPRWSPDGRWLAFVSSRDKKPQIYLLRVTAPGGEARPLTRLPNGAAQPAWSPDSRVIAFLSPMNAAERAQEDEGLSSPPPADKMEARHREERREQDETNRFDPRIIRRIPYREGTSYNDDRFQQIYLQAVDEPDAKPRRLTNLDTHYGPPQWMPDGQSLLTARSSHPDSDMPRRWNNLYRIRVTDGEETCLTGSDTIDSDPLPSPDGRWIAYIRNPFTSPAEHIPRLAVLPTDGSGEPRDLNLEWDRGADDGSYRWTADSSALLFTAASEGRRMIYRVTLADGRIEPVVNDLYEATGLDVARDGSVAYSVSTPENPSELMLLPSGASTPLPLTQVNKTFLEEVLVQPFHEIRFQAENGPLIQGWYLLPPDHQKGQQHPLALNIHGGPFVMWGPATQSMWHEFQVMAASGYCLFFCNPRGAAGYGEAFQKALHAAWGDIAYPDLMAGVDAVIAQGIVDEKRLAVTGGSYGGYMTAWIVSHTDRFVAAASQRGVYNLVSFYGVTDIPWFLTDLFDVTPMQDVGFLWRHSPLAYADHINTPLLILHSENDFRVPISDGEQLFAAIKLRGGEVQFVRFPREGHELSRTGEPAHRVSRLQHIMDWFNRYCR